MKLKLEVGKVYIDGLKRIVRIVCIDRKSATGKCVIGLSKWNKDSLEEPQVYTIEGKSCSLYDHTQDIVREWKEPIVHRRDVIWYKNGSDTVYDITYPVGYPLPSYLTELKRETVEYIEEL